MVKKHEFKLNIGIPNGIILFVIGILTLITPFVHSMSKSNMLIDLLAGMILIIGGSISMYFGIRNYR